MIMFFETMSKLIYINKPVQIKVIRVGKVVKAKNCLVSMRDTAVTAPMA